ncbi:BTAD domain-containing putative transcriptional regulator [Nonomuraea indica]|uniref:BTAD domain-containing putative transcriptional regulator n=1 Tax=Nonomuraea indica TaxID=1581193 RepID=UPI003183D2F9
MVRFGVLGPLEVRTDDGDPVPVGEPKVRALLADLLAHGGGPVPADRLIDDLWGGRPSRNPLGTLQARVSQLRRALGDPALVAHGPAGYRLADHWSDARRFDELLARRSGDPRERMARLDEALALWRGPAFADFADADFARAERTRLEQARLDALEEQAELRLALGEDVDLAGLVAAHPLRERLHGLHMKALYRGGRQGEALAVYTALRERLAEELGVDPSPELAALHAAVLRHDPGLAGRRPAPANLPAALSALVGRQEELATLRELLASARLVTLTGPGGVGKTSLALEAARAALDGSGGPGEGFPDGVWLVELAGGCEAAQAVAAVLGVRDDGAGPLPPRLAAALAERRMLLVLDNCEHLVEETAALVTPLLRAAPHLRVLATSQEPLGVTGEHVLPVAPLAEPEAVRLFTTRAGIGADEHVATVVRRLDGIPLALELAATRVRALGVRGLAERLDDRFRLLNAGARDAPPRQRTLRATIDWSWGLLTDPERVVLRRLAAHADGCTLEAAEEVCAEPGVDVFETVARLVDRSLVVVAPGPRYRLLESVAAYCAERLAEAGEQETIRERHARHYTELAERADLRGPGQLAWLRRLDAEAANLRLALAGPEPLRLANALAWYWYLRGRLGEARRALTAALAHGGPPAEAATASVWLAGMTALTGERPPLVHHADLDEPGRALAGWFLTHVRWAYGDHEAHEAAVNGALTVFERLGDRWGTAAALAQRARLRLFHGDLAAMRRDAERSLALFTELGDAWGRLEAMDSLDRLAEMRGDYAEAARLRQEELRLAERLGFETAFKLSGLGRTALLAGDYVTADDYHERARRLAVAQSYKSAEEHAVLGLALSARRQGDTERAEALLTPWLGWLREVRGTSGIALVMAELGFAAEQRGDAATALARQRAGHEAALATGDPRGIALALEGLAGAVSLAGEHAEAARLLGAAAAVRRAVGTPLAAGESFDVERITARVRGAIGEAAWERAYASGERELGDHFPGAFGGRARVQAAAERLHPLGHPDQPETAAQP